MAVDVTELSQSQKAEIAEFIKKANLEAVNQKLHTVEPPKTFYVRSGKRILDFVFALMAVIVTSPINLLIAVVAFFDVGKPIIFRQQRIGKDEKPFVIYKFRNMTNAVDANGEPLPPEQRVTKWGKFVRKTSLDELLNFASILKGDMSFVGPRPLLDYYEPRLHNRHRCIYKVRPGLECPTLHKVDYILNWQERLDNYVWYVENCSFSVDVRLLFRIAQVALDRKATAKRATATNGGLMGYDKDGNVIYTKAVPEIYVNEFLDVHGYETLQDAIEDRFCVHAEEEKVSADV